MSKAVMQQALDALNEASDWIDPNEAVQQGILESIKALRAELAAETQRRWDGNRIASDEATADFNEMRDMAVKEMARWAREAGASQARESKLREIIDRMDYREGNKVPYGDSTALKEAIKQGQRELLLEAADRFNRHYSNSDTVVRLLKEMAEELK
jgi:hypothetical protein